MDHIKDGRLEGSRGEWVQGVAFCVFVCGVNIAPDLTFSNSSSEILRDVSALEYQRTDTKVNEHSVATDIGSDKLEHTVLCKNTNDHFGTSLRVLVHEG